MPGSPDIINNIILYMMRQRMSIFWVQSSGGIECQQGFACIKRRKRKNHVAKRMYLGYNPTESIFGF